MFHGMEYIYEVYKEKSFSRAAQNLYISQPALSASIKKIEKSIGLPIFDRSTYPIRLTECGEEYVKCIEKIMDVENGFDNYLNNLNELKTGKIAIGSNNIYASYILPPIIAEFTRNFPLIEVKLVEANTVQLEQQLLSGALDIVVDNYAFDEKICSKHFLFNEHLILMAHPNFSSNELVKEYQLTIDDILKDKHLEESTVNVPLQIFKEEQFVLLKSGNDSRTRANKMCQNSGFAPKTVLELDQLATAYNIARYGMGITFISDTLARKVSTNSELIFYKLDSRYASREVFFYTKRSKYITRAIEEFFKIAAR
jgi:DNA-binding transcriptional LysR family regulator